MRREGFSLVEMLAAILIASVVMMMLFDVYLNAKKTFLYQNEVMKVTDSARSAVIFLSKAIKNAGDISCLSEAMRQNMVPIMGYYHTKPNFLANEKIMSDDLIVISGCNNSKLLSTAYYVGDTKRKNKQKETILALYQKTDNDQRAELVPNIKNLKIWYGVVDTAGQKIIYSTADTIVDWRLVRTIKIIIELSSSNPILTHPPVIYLTYSHKQYQDRYLHKEWLLNISLRNK